MPVRENSAICADRLWDDLMALAQITEPNRPYTRRSFTPRFLEGRAWLRARFEAAGLKVRQDSAVNLIARREGTEPGLAPIMIGSHSDTVPSGGRFDGTLGVLAGLELMRALNDLGITTRHPVELVDFLAEEPSEYGVSCVGSRAMTGALSSDLLRLEEPDGESLGAAIRRIGGDPDALDGALRNDIAAYLELHIEQGRVLESAAIPVGIVTGIVGIRRIRVIMTGAADHAGATPFDLREDTLVAAAMAVTAVRRIGEDLAASGRGYFIATTGVVTNEPNAANVVPGQTTLVIEARAEDAALLDLFEIRLNAETADAALQLRVRRSRFERLSTSAPALCDPRLQAHMAAGAADLGLAVTPLASGAGHDAAFIARIAPMAMVFAPSRAGKSHCPEEWTDKQHCADGAAVLLETVLRIDRDPAFDIEPAVAATQQKDRPQ